jgi:hypothetical protein
MAGGYFRLPKNKRTNEKAIKAKNNHDGCGLSFSWLLMLNNATPFVFREIT